MKKFASAMRFILLGLALSYGFPAACGSGGVVGGKCRSDHVNCNGECTNLSTDRNSCGTCGNVCEGELVCVQGECKEDDGSTPAGGASTSGGQSGESGNDTGGFGQGGRGELPDGGFLDAPVDGQGDGGPDDGGPDGMVECLPPHDVPSHCGDCDTQCSGTTPYCAPAEPDGFECVPLCEDPLVPCDGKCVDPITFQSDPNNCGVCGNVCPSGICQAGDCVGASYGNQVFICMNLAASTAASAPTTLLGNSVFLPPKNPVNVMAYTNGARASAVTKVNQVINWAGSARGRTANIVEADSAEAVTANLNINDFSVLLIHDLTEAPAGQAAADGSAWADGSVLSSFSRAGGVVVVLNGGGGRAEMHELISAAGLLDVTGQTNIDNAEIWNQAPFDAVGVNVLSPFRGTPLTCTFDTTEANDLTTLFVLTDDDGGGDPVVIHRVIAP